MRIGDVLYFSPRFRFSDLDVGDTGKFIEAGSADVGALCPRLRLVIWPRALSAFRMAIKRGCSDRCRR
jgi:hypothetical protein